MWKVIAECLEGTSHRKTSQPCQDNCRAQPVQIGAETLLIVVCSDGAGSAELSEVGSRIACDRFFDVAYDAMKPGLGLSMASLDRDLVLEWYRSVHKSLADEAARREIPIRQLACTLLTAIIGEDRSVFAQVGDGSIVYLDGDRHYSSAFWPQMGEYANTTNFVTQSEFETSFEFIERAQRVDEIAVFTDGLQRLALNFSAKAVHQQFFRPMFDPLRAAEHADELTIPLRTFLDSPVVNERTDDDKTLVLATRVQPHVENTVAV